MVAAGGATAAAYEEILATSFGLYERLTVELMEWLRSVRAPKPGREEGPVRARPAGRSAFDAARYLLTPAILTKWGMVVDARTLSDMITELLSHPLAEFQVVGERLKQQGDKAVGTLLAHARRNEFLAERHKTRPALARTLAPTVTRQQLQPSAELVSWDRDLDDRLLASLAYESSNASLAELIESVKARPAEERRALMQSVLESRGPRDAMPFALEGAQPFEFEILVDFGAYRDIGRHRKGIQQQQILTTAHGYLVPPLIEEAGLIDDFREVLDRTAELQQKVASTHPLAAGYVTPFAFLQRVRLIFDPRQICYFIELRSGPEGHFAYRDIAIAMYREVEKVSPLFASLIRVQIGDAFLGRMEAEQGAEERRRRRMIQAGDLPAE